MCKRKENLCMITGVCWGYVKEKEGCHVLSQLFEVEKEGLLRTKLQEEIWWMLLCVFDLSEA